VLNEAVGLAGDHSDTLALAYRFLGDITLNIRADADTAERQFERALAAAREGGNRWSLARTLLTAAWVPYWRDDHDGARAMFEEALAIARANPEGDRWVEARALTSLASLGSPGGHPERSLELADRALALGKEMGDPFTVATAQERRAGSLRWMWRLDEALRASDEATRIYRELGARWELASALGDRGMVHRLQGRLEQAESDLREALDLCRQLGDRVLIAFTVSELATILVLRGNLEEAREIVESPELAASMEPPGEGTALFWARTLIALASGDRDAARSSALQALEVDRRKGPSRSLWASTWWVGRFFGAEAVGGDDVLDEARQSLEEAGWRRALEEPDQMLRALTPAR
jgi:tetratricopeptide (TPR) repeat protein